MEKISALVNLKQLAAILFTSTLLFAAAAAQAEQRPIMTTHVPQAVSSGVAPLIAHVPGTQRFSLAISLPPRNQAELDDLLQQLYDPHSPNYQKYLTVDEFSDRFGPTESDYEAVLLFAQTYGLAVIEMFNNRMR